MKVNYLDSSALISRLCGYYQNEGDSLQQAIKKVRSELGSEYYSAIDFFESSLSLNYFESIDSGDLAVKDRKGYAIVASLSSDVSSLNGDNGRLLNIFSVVLNQVTPGLKSCARFFSALFLYPSVLFLISLLIYSMYKLFVFPSLSTNFFNDVMPSTTKVFFSNSVAIVIAIFSILLIFFFIWQIQHLARAFKRIKPSKTLLGKISGVDQHHAYIIFLAYYKVLLECDAEPTKSLKRAEDYAKLDLIQTPYYRHHKRAFSALKGCKAKLMLQEIDYQLNDVMRGLDQALTSKQEKVLLMFQFFIIFFIGYMVITMYLPIFKLASLF